MPSKRAQILYMGDGALDRAAAYLAGVLHRAGLRFEHVPSARPVREAGAFEGRRLVVLSDYPARNLGRAASWELVAAVRRGCGLLMAGGWSSFHGTDGRWDRSPVSEALPVLISGKDDRLNLDQAAFLRRVPGARHPVLAGLPWDARPPAVGGFNAFQARPGARVLLEAVECRGRFSGSKLEVRGGRAYPMLALWDFAAGRSVAFATDFAPHWVGPLVDWGPRRVRAQAPGSWRVETGCHYARFLEQLVRWAGRF